MNVPAPVVVPDEPELHLLPGWEDTARGKRTLEAAIGSVLVHVVLVCAAVALAAWVPPTAPRPVAPDVTKAVHLVDPPSVLTQTEPNKTEIAREVRLENLLPRLEVKPSPRAFSSPPAPSGRGTPAPPPVLEAPQVKLAQAPPPGLGNVLNLAGPPLARPPQILPEEKPKLAFETPGSYRGTSAGSGHIEVPKASLQEAIRNASRPGPGDIRVGDSGADQDSGLGQLPGNSGSSGRQASTLELQSDPMGVDFRPYLTRVITAVRRNWFSVWPESARLGQRGRSVLLFSIDRSGKVPKLAIDMPSGTQALDRAAVAGISASTPFPPLPAEYKGDVIRLRLVFYYNMQAR